MVRQEILFFEKGVKNMPAVKEIKDVLEDMVSSYEARIQNIGAIFETGQFFEGFQDSFLETKQEREKISAELRENLAKNESLRKKDFDSMMQDILLVQDEREKEIKGMFKTYLNEEKERANTLKDGLAGFKEALAKGEVERIRDFQKMMQDILTRQNERKNEVSSSLKEFQKEQKMLAERLKELLVKGREIRTKDLKLMLKKLKEQKKERMAQNLKRKEEICKMREKVQNSIKVWKNQKNNLPENTGRK